MIKIPPHWSTINNFLVYCRQKTTAWFYRQNECECCLAPAGAAGFLCPSCTDTLPRLQTACSQCAEPLPQPGRCQRCQQQPPAFDYAFCAYRYEAPVSLWLQRFKDQRQLRCLPRLTWLMEQHLPTLPPVDAVTYVPSTRRKLLQRGFNPAGLLAAAAARMLQRPLLTQALQRKQGQDQRGLTRRQRQYNLQASLSAGSLPLQGQHILLIEDVITTGATADAAARALKQQGAAIVGVWALARTPLKRS